MENTIGKNLQLVRSTVAASKGLRIRKMGESKEKFMTTNIKEIKKNNAVISALPWYPFVNSIIKEKKEEDKNKIELIENLYFFKVTKKIK